MMLKNNVIQNGKQLMNGMSSPSPYLLAHTDFDRLGQKAPDRPEEPVDDGKTLYEVCPL